MLCLLNSLKNLEITLPFKPLFTKLDLNRQVKPIQPQGSSVCSSIYPNLQHKKAMEARSKLARVLHRSCFEDDDDKLQWLSWNFCGLEGFNISVLLYKFRGPPDWD